MSSSSQVTANIPEGILLGLGNPLLDITVTANEDFLRKYGLKPNDAILAQPSHLGMFDDMMKNYKPIYLAGGATQNSIRIAQWLLKKENATTYFGCVGEDEKAEVLRKVGRESGVNVHYCVTDKLPTGTCGAVITGSNRSLVAHLGAADFFQHEWMEHPDQWKYVEMARYIYIGGFVFSVCHQGIFDLAQHCCDNNKTLIMNLSAPFLCKYYADEKHNIMQYIDILFGNETEAATLCQLLGLPSEDLGQMALAVSQLPKSNKKKNRVVVFTQGKDPMYVAHDGTVKEYVVKAVPKEKIKDTNGCGDAFVGGYLSELIKGKSIEDCIQCGMYASHVVIQHWGCNY